MKHRVIVGAVLTAIVLLSSAGLPSHARAAETVASETSTKGAEGAAAPAWSLQDLEGRPLTSADFKGKVVVVDFWATWCGPCVAEIPGYIELQNKYRDQGVVFVGLSLDAGPDIVRKFVKARKINYLVGMADDDVQAAFGGFEAIPTTFVINREGRIHHKKTGSASKEDFEAILKPLLK